MASFKIQSGQWLW